MVTGRSDRAQLILVGAIALAFIILGLVVVFNGVLYTQTISSGNDLDEASSAEKGSLEIERGLRGAAQRVNGQADADANSTIEDAVEENVTAFAGDYSNVSSRSGGYVTNVESAGSWRHGRIVDQETTAPFTNNSALAGESDWNVYNDTSDRRAIPNFVVTINVTASDPDDIDNFEIVVANESDDLLPILGYESELSIGFDDGDSDNNLTVDFAGCTETFDARADGTVRFDFTSGIVNGDTEPTKCDIRIGNALEGPYERVRFEGGDGAEGTYEIVFDGGDNDDGFERNPDAAVLEFEIDYQYASGGVTFERTLMVDVYGGEE